MGVAKKTKPSQPGAQPLQQLPAKASGQALRTKQMLGHSFWVSIQSAAADMKQFFSGEVFNQASYRALGSVVIASVAALLAIGFPEQAGPLVLQLLGFLTEKFTIFLFGVETTVAVIVIGLRSFLGIKSVNFDAVALARKAITSALYYAFSGMGGLILFAGVLNYWSGHRFQAVGMLLASLLAYAELYLFVVPAARWLLGRPSEIDKPKGP